MCKKKFDSLMRSPARVSRYPKAGTDKDRPGYMHSSLRPSNFSWKQCLMRVRVSLKYLLAGVRLLSTQVSKLKVATGGAVPKRSTQGRHGAPSARHTNPRGSGFHHDLIHRIVLCCRPMSTSKREHLRRSRRRSSEARSICSILHAALLTRATVPSPASWFVVQTWTHASLGSARVRRTPRNLL
jgi:hypothetical protein